MRRSNLNHPRWPRRTFALLAMTECTRSHYDRNTTHQTPRGRQMQPTDNIRRNPKQNGRSNGSEMDATTSHTDARPTHGMNRLAATAIVIAQE